MPKLNHALFQYNFLHFKENVKFKSHKIKSNHRVLRKDKVDTYGVPVFAPDSSATVLAAKLCTNSNEHSTYIRFPWGSH
jgi:hypothetical protein